MGNTNDKQGANEYHTNPYEQRTNLYEYVRVTNEFLRKYEQLWKTYQYIILPRNDDERLFHFAYNIFFVISNLHLEKKFCPTQQIFQIKTCLWSILD